MFIIKSDTREPYVPPTEYAESSVLLVRLLPGYYTPETFVTMINKQAQTFKLPGGDKKDKKPKYLIDNGMLRLDPGLINKQDGSVIHWEASFDDVTRKMLGLIEGKQRPVFLNQGLTNLFLYSDLVYPSTVGDQSCEILEIMDGQTEKGFGQHCTEVYENMSYHALAKTSFQEIRVYIRDDNGRSPNFQFGRVILRLCFKRVRDHVKGDNE